MTELAYLCARWAHHIGTLLAFGSIGLFLLANNEHDTALTTWRKSALRFIVCISAVALFSGFFVLLAQLASLPESDLPTLQVLERLLGQSRFGLVWKIREALLAGTLIFTAAAWSRVAARYRKGFILTALFCTGASLVAAPFSGHSAAAEPAWPALSAHVIHLLAVGAWLGALPLLTSLSAYATTHPQSQRCALVVLQRFSILALPLMLLIVFSGVWIGVVHVDTFPALLGTRYGYILIAKLTLLAVVLVLAARLRWRLLPMLGNRFDTAHAFSRWVRTEWMLAIGIAALAVWLAQTIPAKHDTITWLLPFRVSIDASWDADWMPAISLASLAIGSIGLMTVAVAAVRRSMLQITGVVGAILLATGTLTGLWAVSVEAYPGTYWQPSIPYQTISVAAGAKLFQRHCATCHGGSAHGDGPAASALPLPPADLTEPHTAYHTAGDIFWWLTYGKPPGVMPGFAHVLSEDERWDLINYLRVLSAGYQARILKESIVPERPWLGAVDFNYTDQTGRFETLKDHRERNVVVLVLFSPGESKQRMDTLTRINSQIEAAGALVIAVPSEDVPDGLVAQPFRVVMEGAEEAVTTYSLMRRTLTNADARDEHPVPVHMEFLIDRYGYVRARWLPAQDDAWNDTDVLLRQIAVLAREPKILEPPDDHVH